MREVEVAGPRFWRQRVPAGPAMAALYRSGALFVQRRAGAPGAAAGLSLGAAAGAGVPDVHDLLPHVPLQVMDLIRVQGPGLVLDVVAGVHLCAAHMPARWT